MSNYTGGVKNRRKRTLNRLQEQLKLGTKPEKVNATTGAKQIPLTEKDIERIEKEISILKTKL